MEKLSFSDLLEKKAGLEQFLESDREYGFELVLAAQKDLNRVTSELEDIRDAMPDDAEGIEEFQQKKIELIKECGGEIIQKENMTEINTEDGFDLEKFEKEMEGLKEEYSEALEKQEEINEKRQEIINSKVVEIDWHYLDSDLFPDTLKPKELPRQITDLIK